VGLLDDLPESALVLDVGGGAAPLPRADWVVDLLPFESSNLFYRERGEEPPECRVTPTTWLQRDICDPEPWPFDDGAFDFVYCSQTLEDVRDPVRVCREMSRVGHAGYVAAPGAIVELTRGIESPLWCGWRHHRWLLRQEGNGGIVFLHKPHHVHSPLWPSVRTPRRLRSGVSHFELEWTGGLPATERTHFDSEALDAELLAIVRAGSVSGRAEGLVLTVGSRAWESYRRARALLGRARSLMAG
jgi:SAM-dependent methyltransferase